MGAILGSLVLGAAPLASVPHVVVTFNPAWAFTNLILDEKATVLPA